MKIDGTPYRGVWVDAEDGWSIRILDQTKLPWSLDILRLASLREAAHAIRSMQVRGAPLIGATAAYGLALAVREDARVDAMEAAAALLAATRPTAVNLGWALERMLTRLRNPTPRERVRVAYEEAQAVADEAVRDCERIGEHGRPLIEAVAGAPGRALANIAVSVVLCLGAVALGHAAAAALNSGAAQVTQTEVEEEAS